MPDLNDDLSGLARAIVRGEETSSRIDSAYTHYSAAIALDIYRNNYRGNLHDALAGAYPVMEQLVGRDFFRHMTRQFIGRHPPRSGNLHHYGAQMAAFVAAFEAAQTLPYLADVAALEWACHCAYFADDAAALNLGQLAQIAPEHYPELILHTACNVVCSSYPLAAIWHAHQPGASCDFHIDLDSGACNALVSRKDDVVVVSELAQADAAWLKMIQSGTPLGAATAAMQERYADFNLQAALLNLVAHDAVSGFSLGATP